MLIWIPILAVVFLDERVSGKEILGLVVAGVGTLIVQLRSPSSVLQIFLVDESRVEFIMRTNALLQRTRPRAWLEPMLLAAKTSRDPWDTHGTLAAQHRTNPHNKGQQTGVSRSPIGAVFNVL